MSHYRNQLEDWLKTLTVETPGFVLDIGGASNPVKDRVAKFECKGCDYLDNELEKPVEGLNVMKGDIQDYAGLRHTGFSFAMYDVAFCLEVMEYILDPMVAIANIAYLMNKDGIIYITFPFVYPWHNPIESDYLRYTPKGACKLMEANGFEVLETWNRTDRSGLLSSFYKADGMHAKGDRTITGTIIKAKKV
jgi:SAM-dependent methyltransferase